jgi:hypothetical protein
MAGLVPAIHVFFLAVSKSKTWMPGTRLHKAGHDGAKYSKLFIGASLPRFI